jgi:hypothetical protein
MPLPSTLVALLLILHPITATSPLLFDGFILVDALVEEEVEVHHHDEAVGRQASPDGVEKCIMEQMNNSHLVETLLISCHHPMNLFKNPSLLAESRQAVLDHETFLRHLASAATITLAVVPLNHLGIPLAV